MTRLVLAVCWLLGFVIGCLAPLPPVRVDGFEPVDRKMMELA